MNCPNNHPHYRWLYHTPARPFGHAQDRPE